MEFDLGSSVTCTDGRAGRVVGLIADPIARALAHIAVEPGHHPEVEIRRHEHVHATDGAIGRVEGLVVDEAGHIAHVLLQEGHPWGRKEVAIPLAFVERTDMHGIHVRLSKREIADLQDPMVTETPGEPVSYLVLAPGTPVYATGWVAVGRVREVLAEEALDVFDGITIRTHHGDRFVDADQIDSLYERAVLLTLSADQCRALPRPRGRRA
jgi:hypothetical protein